LLAELLRANPVSDSRVLIGPGVGRDSAAIRFGDTVIVVKTDPITFPTENSAWHLVHVNANDIACQGATPRWLLVTALLPEGETTVESISMLFARLFTAAREIGVDVIGGHTEVTLGLDRTILVGTMLGETSVKGLIDPANATPGDRLLMTKTAGIEGTALLASALIAKRVPTTALDVAVLEAAAEFARDPGISILREATALRDAHAVTALHDPTEGGIATAIRELAMSAGCGAFVSRDAISIAPETRVLADTLGVDPLGLLSSGSLLAAVRPDAMAAAEEALNSVEIPFSWIGKLTSAESGMVFRTGSIETSLPEFEVDEVARILAGN
jgi:hydrogenase maturation factor